MAAIYTSPLERAIETATALAEPHGLKPLVRERLGEVRFGDWEGKTFYSLDEDEVWHSFNLTRSMVPCPQGEFLLQTQMRMVLETEDIRARHKDQLVAIVSHGDPLRSLISYYLGSSLDLMSRFVINPAGVSIVQFPDGVPNLLCINSSEELPL